VYHAVPLLTAVRVIANGTRNEALITEQSAAIAEQSCSYVIFDKDVAASWTFDASSSQVVVQSCSTDFFSPRISC
jgi:hypothetical protein